MRSSKRLHLLVASFMGLLLTSFLSKPVKAETILQQQGTLEQGDQVIQSDGSLVDLYTFTGQAGQQIRITLESSEFDTYLILVDPDRNKIAENDDANQNTRNAELVLTLPQDGTYGVIVNGYDRSDRGRYELTIVSAQSTGTAQQSSNGLTAFQDLPDGDYRFYDGPPLESVNPNSRTGILLQEVVLRKIGNIVIGEHRRYIDQNSCFIGSLTQDRIVDITYGYQEPSRDRNVVRNWEYFTGDSINLNTFRRLSNQPAESDINTLNYCIQGMRDRNGG